MPVLHTYGKRQCMWSKLLSSHFDITEIFSNHFQNGDALQSFQLFHALSISNKAVVLLIEKNSI